MNSDERIESVILYPNDLDEDHGSQLSPAYFDNTDRLSKEIKVSNLEVNSLSQNHEKEKDKSLNVPVKKKREKINSESTKRSPGDLETVLDTRNKKKMKETSKEKNASNSESRRQKSQVINSPCTQIYELTHENSKTNRETSFTDDKKCPLKCPDYGSDEFADVEDNTRDSSSDNGESVSDVQLTLPVNRYMKDTLPAGSEKLLQEFETEKFMAASCSSSESDMVRDKIGEGTSEHKILNIGKKNAGATCSYLGHNNSELAKTLSVPKTSDEGKKTKYLMPTIAEVAESEDKDNAKDSQSSQSRACQLKMKTKVCIRKDRCNVCGVRLGLCAIRCRCGGYYCAKHRYDKEHNCTFDYKSMGAAEIRKNNPQVIAEKIRKL